MKRAFIIPIAGVLFILLVSMQGEKAPIWSMNIKPIQDTLVVGIDNHIYVLKSGRATREIRFDISFTFFQMNSDSGYTVRYPVASAGDTALLIVEIPGKDTVLSQLVPVVGLNKKVSRRLEEERNK